MITFNKDKTVAVDGDTGGYYIVSEGYVDAVMNDRSERKSFDRLFISTMVVSLSIALASATVLISNYYNLSTVWQVVTAGVIVALFLSFIFFTVPFVKDFNHVNYASIRIHSTASGHRIFNTLTREERDLLFKLMGSNLPKYEKALRNITHG